MEELPSLNLTPWGHGMTTNTPRGRGRGRGFHRYASLDSHDTGDEVPLMSPVHVGGGGGGGGEGEWGESSGEEEDLLEQSTRTGRKRWRQRIKTHSGLVSWFFDRGWQLLLSNFLTMVMKACSCKRPLKSRSISLGHPDMRQQFPSNRICNQKFNVFTFLPLVLFQQFRFFLNLYFLVIALTQFIPTLRIGYLYTYWGPLGFVLAVTTMRELVDDFKRFLRDMEVNSQQFTKLTAKGPVSVKSKDIQVSDIIVLDKDQRIPADMILLRTTEKNGSCFLRTDQLDGETDWKLRMAVPSTQALSSDQSLFNIRGSVFAEKPKKDIYHFIGRFTMSDGRENAKEDPLGVENTLWANTVLASGTATGVVVYTGRETRSSMNTSSPRSKIGLVDLEINRLTKLLFLASMLLSLVLLSLKGFTGVWFIYFVRYVILFSYIIPISLRVNLDMGKMVYSWMIQRDRAIPGTVVRSSTIPEELGRVEFLLTDKTGTLTQNEMVFRKLHMGSVSYSQDSMTEVATAVRQAFLSDSDKKQPSSLTSSRPRRSQREQLLECVKALALCHNVTPVVEEDEEEEGEGGEGKRVKMDDEEVVIFQSNSARSTRKISYQASSPDEIALVKWTESVGLTLIERDLVSMTTEGPGGERNQYEILQLFPFTSERRRMGVVVRHKVSGEVTFYMKGADAVMTSIVQYSDWLEEECGNMAREGLRTLVVGKKVLSEEQYVSFDARLRQARLSVTDREEQVNGVISSLEDSLQLLCLTGVEDQLQTDVRPTLELLRNAGIRVWMLTGDKLETAASIALSSRLVSRAQTLFTFKQVSSRSEAHSELNSFRRKSESALIISGSSLELCIKHYEQEFIELACQSPAVVCCRCSPTHKAQVVRLLQQHSKRPVCAVGDGGNDVSMIQAANVGLGIVGKEGKQASLAADFSITQFRHISRLLVWHGRNSYKRSANLSQFVIHRGLIISVMQAVFSAVFYFAAVALYEGILMVGYATVYTMAPVFSLVLDEDVSPDIALMYPELYRDLMKGRSLSLKTFFLWVLISLYQGGVIMLLGFLLFEGQFVHVVAITFTSLILNELLLVALTIRSWHGLMLLAELLSILVYLLSLVILKDYFDGYFLLSAEFVWKTLLILSISCLPLFLGKFLRHFCAPPSYAKLLKENSMFRNCCKFVC